MKYLTHPQIACFLLIITLLASIIQSANAQEVLDGAEAVEDGWITVEATPADSYSQMDVTVENNTDDEQVIDMSTLGLEPESGKEQRVGLSYAPSFGPGHYLVALKPHQKGKIRFASRCLDKGRPAPKNGQKYRPLKYPLPEFLVKSLRQGASQEKVWQLTKKDRNWERHTKTKQKGSVYLQVKAPKGFSVPGSFSFGIKDSTAKRWLISNFKPGRKKSLKKGKYQLWSKQPSQKILDIRVRKGQKIKITIPFSALCIDTEDLELIEKSLVLYNSNGQQVGSKFYLGEWKVILPGRYRVNLEEGQFLKEITLKPNQKTTIKLAK